VDISVSASSGYLSPVLSTFAGKLGDAIRHYYTRKACSTRTEHYRMVHVSIWQSNPSRGGMEQRDAIAPPMALNLDWTQTNRAVARKRGAVLTLSVAYRIRCQASIA